jgi:hypothetical protein
MFTIFSCELGKSFFFNIKCISVNGKEMLSQLNSLQEKISLNQSPPMISFSSKLMNSKKWKLVYNFLVKAHMGMQCEENKQTSYSSFLNLILTHTLYLHLRLGFGKNHNFVRSNWQIRFFKLGPRLGFPTPKPHSQGRVFLMVLPPLRPIQLNI